LCIKGPGLRHSKGDQEKKDGKGKACGVVLSLAHPYSTLTVAEKKRKEKKVGGGEGGEA